MGDRVVPRWVFLAVLWSLPCAGQTPMPCSVAAAAFDTSDMTRMPAVLDRIEATMEDEDRSFLARGEPGALGGLSQAQRNVLVAAVLRLCRDNVRQPVEVAARRTYHALRGAPGPTEPARRRTL